jgi:phosphopantetheinyl transferase
MPLFHEFKTESDQHIAIWHVEEPLDFFEKEIGYHPTISNEQKRKEHVAGRFVLQYLHPSFPIHDIRPNAFGKPHLAEQPLHFSISHSGNYVAVCLHHAHEQGIDLQCWTPKVETIKAKFLSLSEMERCKVHPQGLLLAWTAKEAAFKYLNKQGVDFIQDLPIATFSIKDENINIIINHNTNDDSVKIVIKSLIFNDFAFSFVDHVAI